MVTPNNPTSILVPKDQLSYLTKELAVHDCMLIADELFIDFAGNGDQETLENEVEKYPNLVIFKSMSKAYGICGIRIGYMLTANVDFIDQLRQGISIWNINGFAEEFLRLAPQYKEKFKQSCRKVMADRDQFYLELHTIPGLKVYQPDANYIFCRLPDHSLSAPVVTKKLFNGHSIYIKHCAGRTMLESDRYVRIASRTPPENLRLVEALRKILVSE